MRYIKKNIKCLDFDYSSIGWKLKNKSLGIFGIEASLREKKTNKLYFLAKTVMAGNVYGKSLLPIVPNYNFQWLTDGKKKPITYECYVYFGKSILLMLSVNNFDATPTHYLNVAIISLINWLLVAKLVTTTNQIIGMGTETRR